MSRHATTLALAAALVGGTGASALAPAAAETGAADVVTAANLEAKSPHAFEQTQVVRELMRRRGGDAAAAAQLVQMSREFDPAVAAEAFEVLAEAHVAAGKLNLAADTRLLLLQTHPTAPAARDAALWLTHLYGSSEVAHRHRTPGVNVAESDRGLATYGYSVASEFEDAVKRARLDAKADAEPVLGSGAVDSELRFARAVAARRGGLAKPAAALLTPLKHLPAGAPWGDAARVETWLVERGDAAAAPKPLARCLPAAAPPQLDGVLDEACWQGDAVAVVGDPSARSTPVLRLAYDAKFLYLAYACPAMAGSDYSRDDRPRPRDGDLTHRDRVTLVLDADRDYATGWELTIDSRGWTGERCWGDASWNPEWFVAARGPEGAMPMEGEWTVEAAIPWRELTAQLPTKGTVWALSADRAFPTTELTDFIYPQHWPMKAGQQSAPEGCAAFGMLLFD